METKYNILSHSGKPWAVQAAGQPFPNSGGVVVAFSNCQLSIVNCTSSTFHSKFSVLYSKFSFSQGFLYAPFGEITTEFDANFGNDIIPKYSFNAKELDEETGMYYYESRYYKPPVFISRDPMFEKYFFMSPYAYCANNPVKYVDPDGRDIFLVIWTTGTEGNGVGHAGIAVSNYKEENGKMVPDGTYTFYDNWPTVEVDFHLKDALTSVEAHRNVEIINSFDEFTNGSTVSPSENVAPNAVLKLTTTYEQDMATTERLLNANKNKGEYNGAWYNCSSYVSDGLKTLFGKTIGKESMLGPIKSVTPNQLWKDTLKAAEKNGIPFIILKDPGTEVDNIFKNVIKTNNNEESN